MRLLRSANGNARLSKAIVRHRSRQRQEHRQEKGSAAGCRRDDESRRCNEERQADKQAGEPTERAHDRKGKPFHHAGRLENGGNDECGNQQPDEF
jgi:hypothetical protein